MNLEEVIKYLHVVNDETTKKDNIIFNTNRLVSLLNDFLDDKEFKDCDNYKILCLKYVSKFNQLIGNINQEVPKIIINPKFKIPTGLKKNELVDINTINAPQTIDIYQPKQKIKVNVNKTNKQINVYCIKIKEENNVLYFLNPNNFLIYDENGDTIGILENNELKIHTKIYNIFDLKETEDFSKYKKITNNHILKRF